MLLVLFITLAICCCNTDPPLPIYIINANKTVNVTFMDVMEFYYPPAIDTDFTFMMMHKFPWNLTFPVPQATKSIYLIVYPDFEDDYNTRIFRTPIQTQYINASDYYFNGTVIITVPIIWWGLGFKLKIGIQPTYY